MANPIQPMGALGLKIKQGVFFGTPPEIDAPYDQEWCLSTQMTMRATPSTKLHDVEDPIFH